MSLGSEVVPVILFWARQRIPGIDAFAFLPRHPDHGNLLNHSAVRHPHDLLLMLGPISEGDYLVGQRFTVGRSSLASD